MGKLITMLVICFIPNGEHLQEAWRFQNNVTVAQCLMMNQIFSAGGRNAVITVRCGEYPWPTPARED